MSDDCLVSIAHNCSQLTDLRLAECTTISDVAICELLKHCKRLATVDIRQCELICGECFVQGKEYTANLTSLLISGSDLVISPFNLIFIIIRILSAHT